MAWIPCHDAGSGSNCVCVWCDKSGPRPRPLAPSRFPTTISSTGLQVSGKARSGKPYVTIVIGLGIFPIHAFIVACGIASLASLPSSSSSTNLEITTTTTSTTTTSTNVLLLSKITAIPHEILPLCANLHYTITLYPSLPRHSVASIHSLLSNYTILSSLPGSLRGCWCMLIPNWPITQAYSTNPLSRVLQCARASIGFLTEWPNFCLLTQFYVLSCFCSLAGPENLFVVLWLDQRIERYKVFGWTATYRKTTVH